jgi:hypothetical protein
MFKGLAKSLRVGIARRWQAGIKQALSVAGAIWLITEIATKVSDFAENFVKEHRGWYLAFVLVMSGSRFIRQIYEVRAVSFNLPTTGTKIEIRYGDLFAQSTDWLIGVGEFFDSEVGHVVSKNSLHGKMIDKIYNGDASRFRSLVDRSLVGAEGTVHAKRSIQPDLAYRIGTTAVLDNGPHKMFLVAMSRTDLANSKASSDVPTLWMALRGALESIHNFGNGAPLSLPLIGNGQSSINIAPQHLLRLIVLALVDHGRTVGLPKRVTIVVPEDCFEALDIQEICRDWRER